MRPIVVYGGWVIRFVPGHRSQVRVVIAARTKKEAMEAFGVSTSHFRNYFSETGNKDDVEAAMSDLGGVFWKPLSLFNAQLIPWGQEWADDA